MGEKLILEIRKAPKRLTPAVDYRFLIYSLLEKNGPVQWILNTSMIGVPLESWILHSVEWWRCWCLRICTGCVVLPLCRSLAVRSWRTDCLHCPQWRWRGIIVWYSLNNYIYIYWCIVYIDYTYIDIYLYDIYLHKSVWIREDLHKYSADCHNWNILIILA